MATPLSQTLRTKRSNYTLTPAQLDGLASEFYGQVCEGAMAGAGQDEEDEVVILFQSAIHKIEMGDALKCFQVKKRLL